MALINRINEGCQYDETGHIIYVKDITGNLGDVDYVPNLDNPGTFKPVTNTTGYGGVNPLRSTFALFLVAQLKKSTGDIIVEVGQLVNPLADDEFEVYPKEDGWYRFSLVRLDKIAASPLADNYQEDDVIYDSTLKKIVKLTEGEFLPVEPSTLIGTNYIKASNDHPFIGNLSMALNSIEEKKNEAIMNHSGEYEVDGYQSKYDEIAGILRASCYAFQAGEKAVFQKNIEWILTNKRCHC